MVRLSATVSVAKILSGRSRRIFIDAEYPFRHWPSTTWICEIAVPDVSPTAAGWQEPGERRGCHCTPARHPSVSAE